MKLSPDSSAKHVPLLQSIESQISAGGLGLGEMVRIGDDEVNGISQNMPVNPEKHSQVTKSLSSSMHSPLVQLMKSHSEILAIGVGETMTELEGVAVIGKLELSETTLEGMDEEGGGEDEGRRRNSELEIENVKGEELKEGVGVRNGTRRLSELETTKRNEEGMEIGLDITVGVEVMRGVLGMDRSQNSPVNPAKHWQVKLSPKSSATHVPLLQSTMSQICIGGLGVGVGTNIKDSIGTSQNSPVYP